MGVVRLLQVVVNGSKVQQWNLADIAWYSHVPKAGS